MYVLGERLLQLRKERGLKQQDVADAFKVTSEAYGHWERGIREPGLSTLNALADFFQVSVDYLLGRTDDRRPLVVAEEQLPYAELGLGRPAAASERKEETDGDIDVPGLKEYVDRRIDERIRERLGPQGGKRGGTV